MINLLRCRYMISLLFLRGFKSWYTQFCFVTPTLLFKNRVSGLLDLGSGHGEEALLVGGWQSGLWIHVTRPVSQHPSQVEARVVGTASQGIKPRPI